MGSWLLMEGYILGGANIPECSFRKKFSSVYGEDELLNFEALFRQNFIQEKDIERISSWGAGCIRVPFHYRLIESDPYEYKGVGLKVLDRLVEWAEKYNLKIILDLHAACGAQNHDWHSDSKGEALLWGNSEFQKRTIALWQFLADYFKEENAVVGFDLLNEPVLGGGDVSVLKGLYKGLISKIREVNKEHIIFLKGNQWGQKIDFLRDLISDNTMVSIHTYGPLDFTYNFRKRYKYPGYICGARWDRDLLRKSLDNYKKFSDNNNVDMFVGELGVNYRGGFYGELEFLKDMLQIYKEWDFYWTYWTYKAVANSVFPDGIMQYIDNSPQVRREGPVYGWDNYIELWKGSQKEVIDFFKTKNFVENKDIVTILKEYF